MTIIQEKKLNTEIQGNRGTEKNINLCISVPVNLGVVLLISLLAACSGLGGEPRVVATLPPATAILPPSQPPDMADGAAIFAQNCTACHGETGRGDGPRIGNGEQQVPFPPGDFRDWAHVSPKSPLDYFRIITNGNLERLMPPWAEALTDAERWNVAHYVYALRYTPEQIEAGAALWNEYSQIITDPIGDPAEAERMIGVTDQTMAAALANEISSEDDQRAVIAYARSLALANIDALAALPAVQPAQPNATDEASAPDSTAEAAPESTIGTITGSVTNGTAGGEVPADLTLILHQVDSEFNDLPLETTIDPDGAFTFADVTLDPELTYVVVAAYRERNFVSDIVQPDAAALSAGTLELPVTIYELTEDPAVIEIAGIVSQITGIGEGLQVAQVINFRNTSDRMFTSSETLPEGPYPSVHITLPPGAVILGFPEGQSRYVTSEDQSTVIDSVPVVPGEDHVIQVVYLVPYGDDASGAIIDQPFDYAVNGPMRLLLSPVTLAASGEGIDALGPAQVGSSEYQSYGGTLDLAPGEAVRYEISGAVSGAAAQNTGGIPTGSLLPIILIGTVGILTLAAGFVLWWRGRHASSSAAVQPSSTASSASKERTIDALVKQIAELDEAHQLGQINHDLYRRQRAQLKARLAELMGDSD